jgi:hypothetical protein
MSCVWYEAQADLSHGKTKMQVNIIWNHGKNVKENKYVTIDNNPYALLNSPKKLWKIERLYKVEKNVHSFPTHDIHKINT